MQLGRSGAVLLVWAMLGWGQDWGAVRRLKLGSTVEVLREDRRVFRGAVARVTENQLELAGETGRVRFGRSTVRKVRVKPEGRRFGWLRAGWKTVYAAGARR